ncbi:expressed unknown protein [Seminavis robusta]|uniref:Uncharacterized protein n=1 Tax=Seminavis robusta TaxID=568900 RepID=A0A9N8EIM3_9STRA|nr:expressed unknown protein [Seminavis robusta]|eukprot:Sro1140_g245500.1 n/a (470) ;mRNA; f:3042-4451
MAKSTKAIGRKGTGTASLRRPLVGQAILLKGGTGSKRQYNQKKACVLQYPKQGCWMTVRMYRDNTASSTNNPIDLKWRKGGFEGGAPRKEDPLKILDDETLKLVLSFLIQPVERETENPITSTLWLRNVVGRIHGQVRAVNQNWKNSIDRILPDFLGPVHVNFGFAYGHPHWVPPLARWLKNYRVQIETLDLGYVDLGDFPFLSQVIRECHTEHTTKLIAKRCNMSRAMRSNWSSYFSSHRKRNFIDLTTDGNSTGVVSVQHGQKELFETVAKNCPRLKDLSITVTLPTARRNYDDFTGTSLFALESIESLSISLGCFTADREADSNVVTKLIHKLPGLRSLTLSCPNSVRNWRFHIQSLSLEVIDTTGLGKHTYVSCDCPQLRTFSCVGGVYGNGTVPKLTEDQHESIFATMNNAANVVLLAGEFPCPYLSVPNSCEVRLKERLCGFHSFEWYSGAWSSCVNARFNPM